MSDLAESVVYQIKVVLQGISPMIWRRLLVKSDSTIVESDNGSEQARQEITEIERGSNQPENLGLSITEAKTLLQEVQHTLVEKQVAEYEKQHDLCHHCGSKLLHKDKRTIVYRTLFGKLKLPSNRLFHCTCQKQSTKTFQPLANLLTERTTPELLYLESKFASLMSYGLSAD